MRNDFTDATPEEREVALKALGLSLEAVFVPLSQSRNAFIGKRDEMRIADLSLNWRVTLSKDGRTIIETDYGQGIGHAPSYKQGTNSFADFDLMRKEAETGRTGKFGNGWLKKPTLTEVCYSLALDAQSGQESFEDFCGEFGYDPDSRKAEATWRACADVYAKLGARVTAQISKIVEWY